MNRLTLLMCAVAVSASMACGSTSSETTVGPTPTRCGVSLTAAPRSFSHTGGSGNLTVAAARECSWSASSQTAWISLGNPAAGQGDGSVRYTVARNPTATTRQGSVTVNGQTTEVTQEPAPCTFELDRESFELASGGGTERVGVQAPAGCAWQASSSVPWITIVDGAQGSGNGEVRFQVAANSAPSSRTGVLTVAGVQVTVRQVAAGAPPPPGPGPEPTPEPPPGCTYSVEPTSASLGAEETQGAFAVSAGEGCGWSASSDAGWLTVVSGTGSGAGQVTYRAAANESESSRTGRITVNGAVFTVTQAGRPAPSCDFEIDPTSRSIGASGGTGSFEVDADDGDCAWTAVSTALWLHVTSAPAGAGDGDVSYRVDENTGAARTGIIQVAGLTFTVNQSAAATGGSRTVTGDVSNLAGSCPETTFDVGSQAVRTTSSTNFAAGNCERHLKNGTRVRVTGVIGSGGVLVASEVRF